MNHHVFVWKLYKTKKETHRTQSIRYLNNMFMKISDLDETKKQTNVENLLLKPTLVFFHDNSVIHSKKHNLSS